MSDNPEPIEVKSSKVGNTMKIKFSDIPQDEPLCKGCGHKRNAHSENPKDTGVGCIEQNDDGKKCQCEGFQ